MRGQRLRAGAVACVLAAATVVDAQHAGDMLIASTAAGGGALALDYDFATRVLTFESASGGGSILYSATDPGWDLLIDSGGFFPLASGTPVSVEIMAIDPGVSLKVSTTTLTAPGQSKLLGTAPSIHVHPAWQLLLPAGVVGERTVSFRMTTSSAAYAPSATYAAVLSNAITTTTSPGVTTTTLGGPTTTTLGDGTTTTTTSAPGTVTSSTSMATSTTRPGASTTSTTTVPATSTTTTLAPRGELLGGTSLALRMRRGRPTLALVSRDARLGLGGGRGSAADPILRGATLHLAGAGFDRVHPLPARNWRALTRRGAVIGWRYADPKGLAGPVTGALVKTGKLLRVTARGGALGIGLAENPEPVLVALEVGEHRWCLRFGGTVRWKSPASFTARGAPAPAECMR